MKKGAPILAALLLAWAAAANAQTTDSTNVAGAPPSGDTTPAAQPTFAAPPPAPVSTPPDYPRGRFSGVAYVDLYYNTEGNPNHVYSSSGADQLPATLDGTYGPDSLPKVIGQDLSGLTIRRFYFTYDNDLTAKYAVRFRLETDSKSLTSDSKIGVNVKAAYVQVKHIYTRANLLIGMTATPMWENIEEAWGYRSIEKTIADFRGLASAVDLGLQLKGAIDPRKRIGYNALLGTGTGQKVENNRYKRAYLSLPLKPTESIWVEPYADYEWGPGGKENATYKLAAGFEVKRGMIGGEIVDRIAHQGGAKPNREPFGYSLFARMMPLPKLGFFGRFDHWQPDTRDPDRIDSDLWLVGLDLEPLKDVHVLPNLLTTQYYSKGAMAGPAYHDQQARVTFYYKFSKP